jgi:hypothetical protein
MTYTPELRSIPLTCFDCDNYSLFFDGNGMAHKCNIRQPGILIFRHPIDCKEWCEYGECPMGYRV